VTLEKLTLLEAIARMEGWRDPNSRCRRNHNPGNIERGKFATSHGATSDDGRFAIFPDDATGFAALQALLSGPKYRGLTIADGLKLYAPSVENDTNNYLQLVCQWTGHAPTTKFGDALGLSIVA
jgi:hypothetical protein